MAKIVESPENSWNPEYEGIDFTADYVGKIATHEIDYVYFQDDDFAFQLTEENTFYFDNDTHKDMEALAITDPRDGRAWWWFRATHGEFADLLEWAGPHATCIHTLIPRPEVVRNFMRLQERDLGDFVPEDWNNGEIAE